jgi:hypothetical protein
MLGKLSRFLRAGARKLAMGRDECLNVPETILVMNKSYSHKGRIPDRFTQSGDNLSPDLEWKGLPSGTRGIVVIMEDGGSGRSSAEPVRPCHRFSCSSDGRSSGRRDSERCKHSGEGH